jgi:hypothetical protein
MDKTRLLGVGTLAVLLVAVSGNTVLMGQAGAISACYHSITGALRVVAAGSPCLPSESPLVWSVQGVPGPGGPQGPQGPQGSAGNTNVLTYRLVNPDPINRALSAEIPGFGTASLSCNSNGQPGLSVVSPDAYQLHRIGSDAVTSFSLVVNAGSTFIPLLHNPPDPTGRTIDTVWISTGISDLPVWKLEYLTRPKDFTTPCVVAVTVTEI